MCYVSGEIDMRRCYCNVFTTFRCQCHRATVTQKGKHVTLPHTQFYSAKCRLFPTGRLEIAPMLVQHLVHDRMPACDSMD